jgi:hypothetical protein
VNGVGASVHLLNTGVRVTSNTGHTIDAERKRLEGRRAAGGADAREAKAAAERELRDQDRNAAVERALLPQRANKRKHAQVAGGGAAAAAVGGGGGGSRRARNAGEDVISQFNDDRRREVTVSDIAFVLEGEEQSAASQVLVRTLARIN